MFTSIPSLDSILQCLLPVFTQPSFQTHIEVLLGWVMCLGRRTEYGVFQTIQADTPLSRKKRHPFDCFYNFFSRSAWLVGDLAQQVATAIVVRLNPHGLLYLVVDDTLPAQTGQACLRLGLVPRCRGLDRQTGRDRQRQPLGCSGAGNSPSQDQQDLLPADPRSTASCGQEPPERSHVGQGNAPGDPGMVPRSKAGFHRRWVSVRDKQC